ncbi:MAG: Calx-beta domain-containing protein, partial [Chloroflexota bacterium]
PLIDDDTFEGDETVVFTISNPTGLTLGEPSTVEITIVENESGIVVSVIEPMSANEDDGEATVTVGLNQAAVEPIEVTLTTADGSAVAGQDYTAVSTTVTFAAGETTQVVKIPLIDDQEAEGDEDLVLTLSDAVNASLEDNPVYPFVIVDNEQVLSASISNAVMLEEDSGEKLMIFEVSLSAPVEYDVKIRYRTEDDTAIAGQDYVATEGDLIIQSGRIQGFIGVPILGDGRKEGDESFKLILNGVAEDGFGPIAATNTVTGTIQGDDQIQEIFLPLLKR